MFKNIMVVLRSQAFEITHRRFRSEITSNSNAQYAQLHDVLTRYAYSEAVAEANLSDKFVCETVEGGIKVLMPQRSAPQPSTSFASSANVDVSKSVSPSTEEDSLAGIDFRLVQEGTRCNCYVWVSKLIPCRHVFAAQKHLGLQVLDVSLFNDRWFKSYHSL